MTLTDILAWPAAGAGVPPAEVAPSPERTVPAPTTDPTPETAADRTLRPDPASRVPVLEVSGLAVTYPGAATSAVADFSLSLAAGGTLAIVGESGSGKSTTAAALTGLLPNGTRLHADTHSHLGETLIGAGQRTWRRILGTGIAYVPQDTGAGLNPVRTLVSSLTETLTVNGFARPGIPARIAEVLASVGLFAHEHGGRHPHELSGGQRQRALIANALAADPALIIADEPTSALDATVQKQVLDVLTDRVAASGTGLILITHDLGIARERTEDLIVMRQGRIVEAGRTAQVLAAPAHEYTRELLASAPQLGSGRLRAPSGGSRSPRRQAHPDPAGPALDGAGAAVLRAHGITRRFGSHRPAVEGVGIELRAGRTLGIVGESGSGKSTTARILLGAEAPDAGTVDLHGRDLGTWTRKELGRRIRYVHQDSTAALDPHFTVARILADPLIGHRIGTKRERPGRIRELLGLVALDESLLTRTPRELSGGQRQRLAIARAIAVDPEVVILDEPVSALDVRVQAQVLRLLVDLQARLGLSCVFISHDLAVIEQVADDVLVMHAGRTVESGPAAQVLAESRHPYTRTLLEAVPSLPDPSRPVQPAPEATVPTDTDPRSAPHTRPIAERSTP